MIKGPTQNRSFRFLFLLCSPLLALGTLKYPLSTNLPMSVIIYPALSSSSNYAPVRLFDGVNSPELSNLKRNPPSTSSFTGSPILQTAYFIPSDGVIRTLSFQPPMDIHVRRRPSSPQGRLTNIDGLPSTT